MCAIIIFLISDIIRISSKHPALTLTILKGEIFMSTPSVATLLSEYQTFYTAFTKASGKDLTTLYGTAKTIKAYNDTVNGISGAFNGYPSYAYQAVHRGMIFFEAIIAVMIDLSANLQTSSLDSIANLFNAYNDATSLSTYFSNLASIITDTTVENNANTAYKTFSTAISTIQDAISVKSCSNSSSTLNTGIQQMISSATALNEVLIASLTPTSPSSFKSRKK